MKGVHTMIIKKLFIANREDVALDVIEDIDTEETTIEELADTLAKKIWDAWSYPVYVNGIRGDWNDLYIDIYMTDEDTGLEWKALIDLDDMDITLERW